VAPTYWTVRARSIRLSRRDFAARSGDVILLELQTRAEGRSAAPIPEAVRPKRSARSGGFRWSGIPSFTRTFSWPSATDPRGRACRERVPGPGRSDLQHGNNGHWPFLLENDSGAIMVGRESLRRVRFARRASIAMFGFSNHGSRVNSRDGRPCRDDRIRRPLRREGENLLYTASFGGTSSASRSWPVR